MTDRTWRQTAACKGEDPENWVPPLDDEGTIGPVTDLAKQLCATCPVSVECLTFVLTEPSTVGWWAGTDKRDRRLLRSTQTDHNFRPGCDCRYCTIFVDYVWPVGEKALLNSNGLGAQCGLTSTFGKGCRYVACGTANKFHRRKQHTQTKQTTPTTTQTITDPAAMTAANYAATTVGTAPTMTAAQGTVTAPMTAANRYKLQLMLQ